MRDRGSGPHSPGKSQVAICSLEILVRYPLEKQLDGGPAISVTIASPGRSVQPSVNYFDDKKVFRTPSDGIFCIGTYTIAKDVDQNLTAPYCLHQSVLKNKIAT